MEGCVMSTYANALLITYSIAIAGATAATRSIRGPKGMRGRLQDITMSASVAFVGTTTPAAVVVETPAAAGTQVVYGAVTAGTNAAPLLTTTSAAASYGGAAPSRTVAANGSNSGILFNHELPQDTEFRVSTIAGVGGTPAGAGEANITIAWY